MRGDQIHRVIKSTLNDKQFQSVRTLFRPLYNTFRYDIVQPLQNRSAYYRRVRSTPSFEFDSRNVLIVTVDCLRNDHLSYAGYGRETTPYLDTVGTYYSRCVSAAPWTYPSVPSILTGLYPHNHGAVYESDQRNQGIGNPPATVRDDVYTLAELLGAGGYETYFSSAIVTAELPIRGRFKKADVHHDAPAEEMVDDFVEWWSGTDGCKFGYLQLGDLHAPLKRPDEEPFGSVPDITDIEHWDYTQTTSPRNEFERYRSERVRFYDNVLRYVDSEIRRLFTELERMGDLSDTIVIVTSDHGEAFWDHVSLERERFDDPRDIYGTGHGHTLFPEVVFVPLIVLNADVPSTTGWVSTTDIVPTVLTELGLSADEQPVTDGIPLHFPDTDRTVRAEEIAYGYDQQAVVRDEYLLVDSPHEDESVLIDTTSGDVIQDDDIEEKLRSYLISEKLTGRDAVINDRVKQQLSELGYR